MTDRASAAEIDATVASLRAQADPAWELVAVVGAAVGHETRAALGATARSEPRITTHELTEPGGPVRATNEAGARARSTWIACLAPGDTLHRHAVARVVEAAAGDTTDFVYTDEDRIDGTGRRHDPWYKPDWSPDRLRAQHYTGALAAYRRAVVDRIGGFRAEVEGAHHHDLALRMGEAARAVAHVPTVLYHRLRPVVEDRAAGERAITEHIERAAVAAAVEAQERDGLYRLRPRLGTEPLVSIVIPTGGTSRRVRGEPTVLVEHCVRSVLSRSTYQNLEIVCVVDAPAYDEVAHRLEQLDDDRIRFVRFEGQFDFSRKINRGVLASRGEFLVMLNDDIEVITEDWVQHLLVHAQGDGVGAVGARLLFGDGRIQHAGIIGTSGVAGHCYHGYPADHTGFHGNALVPTNFLAVTAACLMTRRSSFEEAGGLSLEFPRNYNDVDYCLKLHRLGYRNVCTPEARLWHLESSSRRTYRVDQEEIDRLRARWEGILNRDPYYSPNFPRWSTNFVVPVYLADGTQVPPPEPVGLYWMGESLRAL